MQQAVARFDRQRGANDAGIALADDRQFLRHRPEVLDAAGFAQRGAGLQRLPRRQFFPRRERIRFDVVFGVLRIDPGQRLQRQPQPDRAVAGDQEHLAGLEEPFARLPAAGAAVDHPAQRQHAADRRWPGPGRRPGPAGRAPADRAAWRPRPARWPAGGVPSTDSSGCPHRPGSPAPDRPAAAPPDCARRQRLPAPSRCRCRRRRPAARGRSRPSRRRRASGSAAPSAAVARPGYCLPMLWLITAPWVQRSISRRIRRPA